MKGQSRLLISEIGLEQYHMYRDHNPSWNEGLKEGPGTRLSNLVSPCLWGFCVLDGKGIEHTSSPGGKATEPTASFYFYPSLGLRLGLLLLDEWSSAGRAWSPPS